MSYIAIVYNIFIASPGDVEEERRIAIEMIHEWNVLHSLTRKIVLQPVMWETHSIPLQNIPPQENINVHVVDQCDLAIAVFWSRLGTPTENADSGTLEEIQRMISDGKKVMLFHSQADLPYEHDSIQLEKVKEFLKGNRSKALVATYKNLDEFRNEARKAIANVSKELGNFEEESKKSSVHKTTSFENGQQKINLTLTGIDDTGKVSDSTSEEEKQESEIMKYLFDHTDAEDTNTQTMSSCFNMQESKMEYYLENLEAKGYVDIGSYIMNLGVIYGLTREGRSYLIQNKIR